MNRLGQILSHAAFQWGASVLLAAVFVWAAWGKLVDPWGFAAGIEAYRIVDPATAGMLAKGLPGIELAASVLLLVPATRRASSLLLLGMLLAFSAAIASAMARNLDISCGCFGADPAARRLGWTELARNTSLMMLCLPLLFRR